MIFGNRRGAAAREAYLTFCAAYDDAVALLPTYYERAVNALQPDAEGDRRRKPDPQERLGEHTSWRSTGAATSPLMRGSLRGSLSAHQHPPVRMRSRTLAVDSTGAKDQRQ